MTKTHHQVSQHYLELRLVVVYGSIYAVTLIIASVLFITMVTGKFFQPLFWSWCIWTFVTAYCFFLFMRALLSPAVQIYPDEVILNHPKRRSIPKDSLKSMEVSERFIDLNFTENSKELSLRIPIRRFAEED